jgi:hypothetical protein
MFSNRGLEHSRNEEHDHVPLLAAVTEAAPPPQRGRMLHFSTESLMTLECLIIVVPLYTHCGHSFPVVDSDVLAIRHVVYVKSTDGRSS